MSGGSPLSSSSDGNGASCRLRWGEAPGPSQEDLPHGASTTPPVSATTVTRQPSSLHCDGQVDLPHGVSTTPPVSTATVTRQPSSLHCDSQAQDSSEHCCGQTPVLPGYSAPAPHVGPTWTPAVPTPTEPDAPGNLAQVIRGILADPEQLQRNVHATFHSFDKNGDGTLDHSELADCLNQLDRQLGLGESLSGKEVAWHLQRFDRDCNGKLDCFEYERLYRHLLLVRLHVLEPAPFSREMFIGRRRGRPEDHYVINEILGQGSFGVVNSVVCKESGSMRAMKLVDKQRAEQNNMPLTFMAEEIDKLKTLDHPAILRLFEYYVDDDHIAIITDMLSGGHLLKVLEKNLRARKWPTEQWVCGIFEQVCKGVAYAHSKGVMHKDLKLDNVMLDSQEPPQAVIIDMGCAELFPPHEADSYCSTTHAGTVSVMAPEIFTARSFNYKCDVWALGCCMYGLLCKKPTAFRKPDGSIEVHPYPFLPPAEDTPGEIQLFVERQWEGPNWKLFAGGPDARDLLARMLTFDVRMRPTMKQVLQHAWFHSPVGKHQMLAPEQLDCLVSFHHTNALERVVLVDVASQVPIDQLHDLSRTFEAMDADDNGRLDAAELALALQSGGLPAEFATEVSQRLCRGGTVEFSSFVAALLQSHCTLFQRHLRDAFNRLDTDGSGVITQDELRQLLLDSHLQRMDADQATQNIFDELGGCRLIKFQQLLDYFGKDGRGQQ